LRQNKGSAEEKGLEERFFEEAKKESKENCSRDGIGAEKRAARG